MPALEQFAEGSCIVESKLHTQACGWAMPTLSVINSEGRIDTNDSSTSPLLAEQKPERERPSWYILDTHLFRESSSSLEALHTGGVYPVILEAADQLVSLVTGLGPGLDKA